MIPVQKNLRSAAGFTLVELAIVMIIIGLLIAGVLKGQALIANAQVTATVAQLKAVDAATTTFKDTYNALPGDITSPTTKLPNCAAGTLCASAGDGNGIIANTPGATPIATEGERFFVHLNNASLITGIVPAAAGSLAVGANFPATKIANNVLMDGGTAAGQAADFTSMIGGGTGSSGTYLVIASKIQAPGAGNVGLAPDQALRIDTKLDDGVPDTGQVLAFGTAGAGVTNCGQASAAGVAGTYTTSTSQATCGLYVHIQ